MSAIQIVCQNCGAKYKIPDSFKGDKAKCKACAAVIDVAAQREEATAAPADAGPAAKPAAAKPGAGKTGAARRAAEKPASTKSEPRRASAGRRAAGDPKGGTARRAGGRRARAEAGDDEGTPTRSGRRRRGGGEVEKKKGLSPVVIGGGLGVIAIAVVVAIFAFGSNGDDGSGDTTTETANVGAAGEQTPDAAKGNDNAAAEAAAAKEAAEQQAAEAAAKEAAEEQAAEVAAKEAAAAKAAAKPPDEITSRDDVFDPSTLPVLEYPEGTADELREEVEHLVQDVVDGGLHGARAKTRLEEIGYPAIFGIINKLRTIDYFDTSDSMTAYELNRLLELMAVGINVGYRPPVIGEEQKLADVDWNARTAKAWHRLPVLYPTAERFDELKTKRETRHLGR